MNLYSVTMKRPDGKHDKYVTMFKFARDIDRLRSGVKKKLAGTKWELCHIVFVREANSFERWHHTPKKQKKY